MIQDISVDTWSRSHQQSGLC